MLRLRRRRRQGPRRANAGGSVRFFIRPLCLRRSASFILEHFGSKSWPTARAAAPSRSTRKSRLPPPSPSWPPTPGSPEWRARRHLATYCEITGPATNGPRSDASPTRPFGELWATTMDQCEPPPRPPSASRRKLLERRRTN